MKQTSREVARIFGENTDSSSRKVISRMWYLVSRVWYLKATQHHCFQFMWYATKLISCHVCTACCKDRWPAISGDEKWDSSLDVPSKWTTHHCSVRGTRIGIILVTESNWIQYNVSSLSVNFPWGAHGIWYSDIALSFTLVFYNKWARMWKHTLTLVY